MTDERDTHPPPANEKQSSIATQGFEGVAMCAEAQADGVPCTELGRKCETCEHALHNIGGEAPTPA